ncbi:divalent-cation tolerance protein CutA [Phreatobacter sp.]|uniref:divalent-cation tolerance protein CutA n=1 Tax=Phreatobacter sp. TaxID=1966341 RepID=UPI0022CB4CD7|nr:divalent-cation tolerance protein CutA [Phreatobacter sp.]MCZ8314895.1 divalent-cation tolerance protein CutA [Phreatobacter sp.]
MTRAEKPDDVVLVYTTAASLVEAETIAEDLVERRLIACANILPGMRSIYRWKGQVERGDEVVMILKTVRARLHEAQARFREAHSYDTPAFLVVDVPVGDEAYLAWLRAETA